MRKKYYIFLTLSHTLKTTTTTTAAANSKRKTLKAVIFYVKQK